MDEIEKTISIDHQSSLQATVILLSALQILQIINSEKDTPDSISIQQSVITLLSAEKHCRQNYPNQIKKKH